MSWMGNIWNGIKKANEEFAKLDLNPWFSHAVDWLGDMLMGRHFFRKEKDVATGKTVRTVNPNWIREEAPDLFAKTNMDENIFREITYARNLDGTWILDPAWRVELFDNWRPDFTLSVMADPNHAIGEIGRNQWQDIRLKIVEEMFKRVNDGNQNCLVPLDNPERDAKIRDLCATLTEIAQLDNFGKLNRFVRLDYCYPREADYRIVKYQRFRRRAFDSLAEFWSDFTNWLTDPGPTGFIQTATWIMERIDTAANRIAPRITNAASGIENSIPVLGNSLINAINTTNRKRLRRRPNRFIRFLIGM